jgi:hypothetical protein
MRRFGKATHDSPLTPRCAKRTTPSPHAPGASFAPPDRVDGLANLKLTTSKDQPCSRRGTKFPGCPRTELRNSASPPSNAWLSSGTLCQKTRSSKRRPSRISFHEGSLAVKSGLGRTGRPGPFDTLRAGVSVPATVDIRTGRSKLPTTQYKTQVCAPTGC